MEWTNPVLFDQESEWGKYKDIKVIDIKNGLNFIPHKGDTKDIDADRTLPNSGETEFWLVEGNEEVFLNEPKGEVSTLKSAQIVAKDTLIGTLNTSAEDVLISDIEVVDDENHKVEVNDIQLDENHFTITTSVELDFNKNYKMIYKDQDKWAKMSWKFIDEHFQYDGNDLGAILHDDGTATLKLWSPPATAVSVILFDKDNQDEVIQESVSMTKGDKGIWEVTLDSKNTSVSDLTGYFYQYKIDVYGETNIALDPYAKSMAAFNNDGNDPIGKAAFINPAKLGPELHFANIDGFEKREDTIIYEIHVRDFTSDPSIEHGLSSQFGTYKAFIDKLDYIADLGITHVQLLPVMSYYNGNQLENAIREMDYSSQSNNYNWGYDPHGYFSPTGMYSKIQSTLN